MRELVIALLLLLVSGSSGQGCTTGELRLFDNGDTNSNRELVQVCYDGSWNTLCGLNGWSTLSAKVVCRQLGYLEYGANLKRLYYGETMFNGTDNFVYLARSCQGDETVLTNCTLRTASPTNCYYGVSSQNGYFYAAVMCQPAIPTEGPTQPPTSSTEANAVTTVTTMPEELTRHNNITEQTVGVSSLLGVGVFTALLTAALMVTIIGWITTCVYYQRKDKTNLTEHTASQPLTQAPHPHPDDVTYDYINYNEAPPTVSCDLTSNEAYGSLQCVTNDSYSVIQ